MSNSLDPRQRILVDEQLRLLTAARTLLGGGETPCFAHLRLESGERTRDLLLGTKTRVSPEVSLLDWTTAPLAEVFFACKEGDDYEVEMDERVLSGTVRERHLLGFERGELVEISDGDLELSRRGGGPWRARPLGHAGLLRPREDAARVRPVSPVDVTLDPAQRRVVELPSRRSVLVLGEAGSGKTIVALHRLAALARKASAEGRPFHAAVIVPTEGLRRLTETLVGRLAVEDVDVRLYDRWAAELAHQAFGRLPMRESRDASAAVIRLKRHRALRAALDRLARRRQLSSGRRGWATRSDLLHLFGDRALLEEVAAASSGALGAAAIRETLEHTHVQFSKTSEEELAHVDRDRLQTVDGQTLDEGTPMEDAGTLDTEDYAVLFELDRLRASARATAPTLPRRYPCVLVDEAQELAPLELALAGRSLAPGGTLIVAGDAGQQVDPTACFVDWTTSMTDMGAANYETTVLEVSYRCPPAVTALARHVLSPRSVEQVGIARAGGSIARARFDAELHLAEAARSALASLVAADPSATVAVICRTPPAARRLARVLGWGMDLRLALDGDFAFTPGVQVTAVEEVKGLEFDFVVIPDASAASYPDAPESRRALYVALTRTIHQLLLLSLGTWSPLLPPVDARDDSFFGCEV